MKNPIPLRTVFSPFVAVAFVVLAATGALLFFHVKNGPIVVLHQWFGWAFVAGGLGHLALNLRPLLAHLRQRAGLVALGVAAGLIVVLTVVGANRRGGPRGGPDGARAPVEQSRD